MIRIDDILCEPENTKEAGATFRRLPADPPIPGRGRYSITLQHDLPGSHISRWQVSAHRNHRPFQRTEIHWAQAEFGALRWVDHDDPGDIYWDNSVPVYQTLP